MVILATLPIQLQTYAAPVPIQLQTYAAPVPIQLQTYAAPVPIQLQTYAAPVPIQLQTYAAPVPIQPQTYPALGQSSRIFFLTMHAHAFTPTNANHVPSSPTLNITMEGETNPFWKWFILEWLMLMVSLQQQKWIYVQTWQMKETWCTYFLWQENDTYWFSRSGVKGQGHILYICC